MITIPRSEAENKRIREAQRENILDAAKTVFARKGWAMTITDIAAAANVSPGLIYHYFPNKEAIVCELLKQTLQTDADLSQRIMQAGDTPTQRLEALINSMLQPRHRQASPLEIAAQAARGAAATGNNLEMMRRIFSNLKEDSTDAADLRELLMKRFQTVRDTMMALITEGQKRGEIVRDAPEKLALMIFQCIQGLSTLALENPEEYDKHYPYTDVIMRMVKP
ncbi:transcriptional regulator [Thermobacillus composti KWC4]|uniref:Transcriptional regulator n=1 Tax=Thermobacillus composti (strain DSM 18247 / JCM 13945 / KWC4) TaxID=717605 RepID=L0ECT4_THECK|nr:TetR/AcrR family transcriptional regulator [Thermobacillus composti]AGA56965.1 transcriptional regulator [Thermobacillus composti KWC4]